MLMFSVIEKNEKYVCVKTCKWRLCNNIERNDNESYNENRDDDLDNTHNIIKGFESSIEEIKNIT